MFDGWWTCQRCLARGPGLNKSNCVNPSKCDEGAGDDDRHRHKRRKTEVELEGVKSDEVGDGGDQRIMAEHYDDNDAVNGFLTNKKARKRAEEWQNQVNENTRRKHIEAHVNNNVFEIPRTEDNGNNKSTDEQTNHMFFNGKE
eukprot:14061353-Heterocapsa_arctica.AAC.1